MRRVEEILEEHKKEFEENEKMKEKNENKEIVKL